LPRISSITSRRQAKLDSEESILKLGKQENIRIESADGIEYCGVCKLKKIKGEVKYPGSANWLTHSEQSAGFILPCITYSIGRVEIEA